MCIRPQRCSHLHIKKPCYYIQDYTHVLTFVSFSFFPLVSWFFSFLFKIYGVDQHMDFPVMLSFCIWLLRCCREETEINTSGVKISTTAFPWTDQATNSLEDPWHIVEFLKWLLQFIYFVVTSNLVNWWDKNC
jgi:hypothetical protein